MGTSKRIQKAMELRGLKQTDLVEKTGISKGALSSYISGRYIPKQNNTFLIAKALNVNEAWLMGADVPMERDNYEDQNVLTYYPMPKNFSNRLDIKLLIQRALILLLLPIPTKKSFVHYMNTN